MVIFSKPNWNWFGKRVVKIVIFFQTKLELVWKTSRQNFDFFSKPNWNWFGNGHRIKCSCSAYCLLRCGRTHNYEGNTLTSRTSHSTPSIRHAWIQLLLQGWWIPKWIRWRHFFCKFLFPISFSFWFWIKPVADKTLHHCGIAVNTVHCWRISLFSNF